jgi:hypothetical protein
LTSYLGGGKENCFFHQVNNLLCFRRFLHKILGTFPWVFWVRESNVIFPHSTHQCMKPGHLTWVSDIRVQNPGNPELDNSRLESGPDYVQNQTTWELMVAWSLCARGLKQEFAKHMPLLRTKSSYLIPPFFFCFHWFSLSPVTMITLPLALL